MEDRGSASAFRALHEEEAARAAGFGRTLAILCAVGLGFIPFLSRVRWLTTLMASGLVLLGIVSTWVSLRARNPARYDKSVFRFFGVIAVCVSVIVTYYSGVFSTSAVVVTLGISFFGLGDDKRFAVVACCVAAVAYALVASLISLGVVPDLGLFTAEGIPAASRIFVIFIVPAVFILTLWQARLSRRATYDAVVRLDEALRLAYQREAQLAEANQNLDRALQIGAGQQGRYTGALVGQWVLGDLVGRGAFGEVYAAENGETGTRAAVKLLHPHARAEEELVRRFLREAEALARIESPNIVGIYGAGETADHAPYLAMDLLEGHTLDWHLRRRGRLEVREVVSMVGQIAAGLHAAHEAGIVHRDIKPQNLFLTEPKDGAGVWKLLDFGVAKLGGSGDTLTEGAIVGTPGYMAPEQASGHATDRRSDVFSLAAVTYRAATGNPPFAGSGTPQVLLNVVVRTPVRPAQLAPELPADVERVLAIGLAKEPRDRFATVEAFALALSAAVRGELTGAERRRADALIEANPWGTATPYHEAMDDGVQTARF